ncbi:hypothetical protein [Thioclava sp. SK-1]|uniref:hypothetical protein n=1 Tax=Thioclava sp. SK-1 TaxID=1889770 RepID=UPI00159EF8CE|nr:hypothetical protein [Thioclava sp. SK-1]
MPLFSIQLLARFAAQIAPMHHILRSTILLTLCCVFLTACISRSPLTARKVLRNCVRIYEGRPDRAEEHALAVQALRNYTTPHSGALRVILSPHVTQMPRTVRSCDKAILMTKNSTTERRE